jgi:hypothetical protein
MYANDELENAVIAVLNGETKASGLSVKSLAAKIDKDYNTFRRYFVATTSPDHRAMPLPVFYAVCEAVNVDPAEVMRLAAGRLNRGSLGKKAGGRSQLESEHPGS